MFQIMDTEGQSAIIKVVGVAETLYKTWSTQVSKV